MKSSKLQFVKKNNLRFKYSPNFQIEFNFFTEISSKTTYRIMDYFPNMDAKELIKKSQLWLKNGDSLLGNSS